MRGKCEQSAFHSFSDEPIQFKACLHLPHIIQN